MAIEFANLMTSSGFSTRVFDPAGQDDIGGGCGQLWFVQQWLNDNNSVKNWRYKVITLGSTVDNQEELPFELILGDKTGEIFSGDIATRWCLSSDTINSMEYDGQ